LIPVSGPSGETRLNQNMEFSAQRLNGIVLSHGVLGRGAVLGPHEGGRRYHLGNDAGLVLMPEGETIGGMTRKLAYRVLRG